MLYLNICEVNPFSVSGRPARDRRRDCPAVPGGEMREMTTITEETRAVKKALIAAGYKGCSVTRGYGSARGWIYVGIRDRPQTQAEYEKVYAIVKRAAGRENLHDDGMTDYFIENISVDFSYYPKGDPKKCQACGATGPDLDWRMAADDLLQAHCKKCGVVVI